MNEKRRQSGFKALLASHKTNGHHLEDADGDHRLWRDLSAEGKVEHIARDAAYYDVSFEQFAKAVRETLDVDAIEEAALRLAMRCVRELHELETLFPEDMGSNFPPPLVDCVRHLLNAKSPEHEGEETLNCEKLAALFKEMRADEAAAKREDAHWYGKESIQKNLGKSEAPAAEKSKDRDIER
jgi:hypothetical protein